MVDILINNAQVVTVNEDNEILQNASVAIKDNKIVDIGDTAILALKYKDAKMVIDATDKAVFPGLVNNHNHLFQTLIKGLGDDMEIGDWLRTVAYPLSAQLTPEDTYVGAMIGLMESLHSGITTTLDYMYAHPVGGLSDAVIKAINDLKVRGVYARGFVSDGEKYGTQKALMETPEEVIEDFKRLVETYEKPSDGMVRIWMAPSSPWANTKDMLVKTWEVCKEYNAGYTVHISETATPRNRTKEVHGYVDTEVLEKFGIVGPNVLMVHCVAINDDDIAMMKKYDMKVSHNPVCNMYLASGVAPIPKMLEEGITVGIGLDGAASNNSQDMIESMKTTALLQKVHTKNPKIITAEQVLRLATIDGAKSLGMDKEIGSLEIGKKADLFIFNPNNSPKSTPMHSPVSTIVYSASETNVETVIVDGKIVMSDSKILGIDEEKFYKDVQKSSVELVKKVYK